MSVQHSEKPFLQRHMKALGVVMWGAVAACILAAFGVHQLREAGATNGVPWLRGLANAAAVLGVITVVVRSVAKAQQMKSPWYLVMFASSIIFVAAIFGAAIFEDQSIWLSPIALAAIAVMTLAAFPLVDKLWDEVRLRAHLDAWFWGGSVGLYLVMFVAAAIALLKLGGAVDGLLRASLATEENAFLYSFGLGALATLAPILLGYGVWWAVWWLRRR